MENHFAGLYNKLNDQIDLLFDEDEEAPIRAVLKDGGSVVGHWTGHGTDFQTGEEDCWLDDQNVNYSEVERFERA